VEPQASDVDDRVVLDEEVVGREHAGVGARHPDVDPGLPHCGNGLDVVPVTVGLEDLGDPERPTELEQPVVLVGGVEQHGRARPTTTQHVDVVVDGADDDPVDLGAGVLVVEGGGVAHGLRLRPGRHRRTLAAGGIARRSALVGPAPLKRGTRSARSGLSTRATPRGIRR
jgi:hypothetical protein